MRTRIAYPQVDKSINTGNKLQFVEILTVCAATPAAQDYWIAAWRH
jgi:hypothetical protein